MSNIMGFNVYSLLHIWNNVSLSSCAEACLNSNIGWMSKCLEMTTHLLPVFFVFHLPNFSITPPPNNTKFHVLIQRHISKWFTFPTSQTSCGHLVTNYVLTTGTVSIEHDRFEVSLIWLSCLLGQVHSHSSISQIKQCYARIKER